MQKTSVKLSSAVKNKIKINMAEFGISVLFSNLCIVSSSEIQYLFRGFDRFHNLILSISRHGIAVACKRYSVLRFEVHEGAM